MNSRTIATGIFTNSEGKYLMNFRDSTKNAPLRWALFGGGIEVRETATEALIREMEEELGIQLTPDEVQSHGELYFSNEEKERYIHPFTVSRPVEFTDITLGEGAGLAFFTVDELEAILPQQSMSRVVLSEVGVLHAE